MIEHSRKWYILNNLCVEDTSELTLFFAALQDVQNFFANNSHNLSSTFKVWNKKLRFCDVVLSSMKNEFHNWLSKQGIDIAQHRIGNLQWHLTEFIEVEMTVAQKKHVQKLREEYEDNVYPIDLRIKQVIFMIPVLLIH